MPSRVLLTGFTKFGSHAVNPAEQIVRHLAAQPPAGVDLRTLILPVEYSKAFTPLRDVISDGSVDAVLLLGLAAGRTSIAVERFALNWRGGGQPDESGARLDGEPIDPAAPAAQVSTLPVTDLVRALGAAGVPVDASSHAGTFLCNQVLYQTLRWADLRALSLRAAFVHLPEPGGPRPSLEALAAAVESAVRFVATLRRPRKVTRARVVRTVGPQKR